VLLLLYVFCQYWQMYSAQRKLALEWQRQDARPATIAGSDGEALVRLTIAKINLDAVIVEGTSRESLKLGPGHMEDSALPGSSGNSVIVAHRDTFFRHLDELQEGIGFTSGDRAKFTDSRLPDVVSSSLRISRPYDSLRQRNLR
jgi:sortase (surface protein transpeptidase)